MTNPSWVLTSEGLISPQGEVFEVSRNPISSSSTTTLPVVVVSTLKVLGSSYSDRFSTNPGYEGTRLHTYTQPVSFSGKFGTQTVEIYQMI